MNTLEITKEDVLFCLKKSAEYIEQAKAYEEKAANCSPRQRGAYSSLAVQRKKDAQQMRANYDALMGQLVEHNYPLYLELKGEEKV